MAEKKDEATEEQSAPKKAAPKKTASTTSDSAKAGSAKATSTKADAAKGEAKKSAPKKAASKTAADSAESASTKPARASSAKSGASGSSAGKTSAKKESATSSSARSGAARETAARLKAEGAGGTLKVHHLRPAPGAHTAKTRVGRGEASKGKTAGRGTKGTKARYQVPEAFEGGQMPLHMRLPKLRGFKNPFRVEYQVVNLEALANLYPKGGQVTVEDLVAKGAVRKGRPVKVLGNGDVEVKLDVAVQKVSATAREKILAAGGSIAQD